jgi:polyphosphate kinase
MLHITPKFYHRDLSWLRFNHRVLQEAADDRNPLYERIMFLAIYSSNLDEFFKVRVSDIRQIKRLDKAIRKKLISKPNKLLKTIKKEVIAQQIWFGEIWNTQLIPLLNENNIFIIDSESFNSEQKLFATKFFDQIDTNQIMTSSSLSQNEVHFVENEKQYLVGAPFNNQVIWVKIPENLNRFVSLPSTEPIMNVAFIDDIMRYKLEEKYQTSFWSVKVSRDADLYIQDEYSGNLVDKIQESLKNRETGQITRILYDNAIPEHLLNKINISLDLNETDVILGGRYHNFKDLFTFPGHKDSKLYFEPAPPVSSPDFNETDSILKAIRIKDKLLHFPYQSFDHIIDLIEEAAVNPSVSMIKITLYRISKESQMAKSLVKALKNGKKVFVFIETKARFDEANNIKWGTELQKQGAKVQYSYPGIKVHSKIIYIFEEKEESTMEYAYIGTGNFNEKTATVYTDYGFATADPKITKEIKQVFEILERKIIIPNPQELLISPYNTRTTFIRLVEKEIRNVQKGLDAYIIIKMNSLEDEEMIKLLYKASRSGVRITLLIRGICCLVPGIENQSDNITVTSIVDRFLEHTRVFIFGNNGQEKTYIGSADWMTRNLDHRIEVIVPIHDRDLKRQIRTSIDIQLADKSKARIIDTLQKNEYVGFSKEPSAQAKIYNLYKSSKKLQDIEL